jgi:predicted nucleotide-binding protein
VHGGRPCHASPMHEELAAELRAVAEKLRAVSVRDGAEDAIEPLRRLMGASDVAAAAWSGSPIGYHARVYYLDFAKVPPGARWSKEWGFYPAISNEGQGDWREYAPDDVIRHIRETAGNPDLAPIERESDEARKLLESAKGEIESILAVFQTHRTDELVAELREQAAKARALTQQQAMQAYVPSQIMTRDAQALGEGFVLAPHQAIQSKIVGIKAPFVACDELAQIAERAAAHIARLGRAISANTPATDGRVFIGHGRSRVWLELKDFLRDRLGLKHEEFNRVPTAGLSTTARLEEMLDGAIFAFVIMTAEDEKADGTQVARENVVHEAGLFQGHLGNRRAIVMLEEGCAEFSNIYGLVEIRFPKDNIKAVFEQVRQVLEREGIVPPGR